MHMLPLWRHLTGMCSMLIVFHEIKSAACMFHKMQSVYKERKCLCWFSSCPSGVSKALQFMNTQVKKSHEWTMDQDGQTSSD